MHGVFPGLSRSRVLPRIVAPQRRLGVEQLESRRLLAPVLLSPATAAVDPGGMTVALAVVAADAVSGNVLTYTWSASGPSQPAFGAANGTSNGAELAATCSQIGTYGFTVTIANQYGESLTSSAVVHTTSPAPNAVSVTVQRQTLVTSSPNYAWYPQLHRMANGHLLLWVQIAPDECIMDGTTPFEHLYLSADNGQTWTDDGISAFNTHSMVTLSDGTFYGLWFWTTGDGSMLTTKAIRSTDNGLTFSIDENVPIYFDGADFGPQGIGTDWGCDGGLLQMPNGDLLASIYGGPDGSVPSRSVLIRSTDDGNTWHYVSTIAFDPNQPNEGYDEPSLIDLGGNRLLSTLRTGVTMYQAVSADGGLTWSAPAPIASFGVEPDLVRTDDGILVCSSGDGHPNLSVYVMCSGDGLGQQWGPQTFLYQTGDTGQLTTGYTAMAQVGPNQILVVFDNYTSARQPAGPDEVFADLLNVQRLPAILASPASGLTTTKSGGTAAFAVTLRSPPETDVTLSISSSAPTEGRPSPASLTFTPANWDSPQQVVVTGQDDLPADGNVGYSIVLGPAVSTDPAFNGMTGPSVSVTNLDDTSCVWTGAGGDGNWMTAANWRNAVAPQPGADLIFSGTAPTSVNNDFPAGTYFHALVFAAGDFALSGNSIKLDALRGMVLSASAGAAGQINLPLTGAGALTGQGAGAISLLAGTNTYGGGTVVNNGTFVASNAQALPDGTRLTIGAGGIFVFDPRPSVSSLSAVGLALPPPHMATASGTSTGSLAARAVRDNSPSRTSRAAEQATDLVMAATGWRHRAAAVTSFDNPRHPASGVLEFVLFDAAGRPVRPTGSR